MIRVSCLGFVFDPLAQREIAAIAPPGIKLSFTDASTGIPDSFLTDADALIVVTPVTEAMLARAPRLRFIQKWGTGYDKIDLRAAARRGIPVAITAGANADTVAEHAVTLMLAVLRRLVVADRAVREGRWIPGELRPVSRRLTGRTVGLVGMGNIGRSVARMLRGFGTQTLYYKRGGPVDDEAALGVRYVQLNELLAQSDIVSLHCPGGAANRHMFDAGALSRMKPGGVLVNVSRGELVVEEALIAALESGYLSGAGLDVFAEEPLPDGSPLRGFSNVVLTPHSAGSVIDDISRMGRHALANVQTFFDGGALPAADVIVDPEADPWRGMRVEALVKDPAE